MIKSDLMKRILLIFLLLPVLISGCGRRPEPVLEHFQGDVVATLQKPLSEETPEPPETSLPPGEVTEAAQQPSETIPAFTPEGTLPPTEISSQSTTYPITTGTTTLTPMPSATPDLTHTATTPMPGVSAWEGAWKIWYQTVSGVYMPADMTIQVNETKISGSAKIDGIDYSFAGEITNEGTRVEGYWKTDSKKGTFYWRMLAANSFVGSTEKRFGFCGDRTSAVQPNPCREVPPN